MAITLANHQFGMDLPSRWQTLHFIINPYTVRSGQKCDFKSYSVHQQSSSYKWDAWRIQCEKKGVLLMERKCYPLPFQLCPQQAIELRAKLTIITPSFSRNGMEEKEIRRVSDLSQWPSSAKDEWGQAKCLRIDLLTFSLKNGRESFSHEVQNNLETNCILNKFSWLNDVVFKSIDSGSV